MSMDFIILPLRLDDAITHNLCQLISTARADLGFNLLNEAPWFNGDGQRCRVFTSGYWSDPNALIIAGLTPPRDGLAKRWHDDFVDLADVVVDDGNSTRFATPEELKDKSLYKCQSEDCREEEAQLRVLKAPKSAAKGNVVVEAARTSEVSQPSSGYIPFIVAEIRLRAEEKNVELLEGFARQLKDQPNLFEAA
jgi:hypothetical protein